MITFQSCMTCVIQAFIYPLLSSKANIPVPYLAIFGAVIQSNPLEFSLYFSDFLFLHFLHTHDGGQLHLQLLSLDRIHPRCPDIGQYYQRISTIVSFYLRPPAIPTFRAKFSPGITCSVRARWSPLLWCCLRFIRWVTMQSTTSLWFSQWLLHCSCFMCQHGRMGKCWESREIQRKWNYL